MLSQKQYMRASMALVALDHFSPLVRESLIDDAGFRADVHLSADVRIELGKDRPAFRRDALFSAARAAFDGNTTELSVTDDHGDTWQATIVLEQGAPAVALVRDGKRLLLALLELLSPDAETRVAAFSKRAEQVGLPDEARRYWVTLLDQRPLQDDEVALVQTDLNDTPIAASKAIRSVLRSGTISFEGLVPNSRRYYERLVGSCASDSTLLDYIRDVAVPLMRGAIKSGGLNGYKHALLLAAHPALSRALSEIQISEQLLREVLQWSASGGDPMSRAACLEIGLGRLSSQSSIREALASAIEALTARPADFTLLAALFVAVSGEMSQRRMFSSQPPFWRRLAALAHASAIMREVAELGVDLKSAVEWLFAGRMRQFVMQAFVDLRIESRWIVELATGDQLRNELLGRVWMAAKANEDTVVLHKWQGRLLGADDGSLVDQMDTVLIYLPGPLEGGSGASALEMPADLRGVIEAALAEESVGSRAFRPLINAALLYRPVPELATAAAAALTRSHYRLRLDSGDQELVSTLLGLACVAAAMRSPALTECLTIVLRTYRRFYPSELSVNDAFRIAVTAAAGYEELSKWTKCIGTSINDIAFHVTSVADAELVRSDVVDLCELVPELWATCGHAEAALQAVIDGQAL